jgi:uncharacterized protein
MRSTAPLFDNMTTLRPRQPALPIGWPLLPQPAMADGRMIFRSLAHSIDDQIRVVLSTGQGEQLMHPEFGAGLARFLHEPNTLQTRARIREEVTEALMRFEARILLDDVQVEESGDPRKVVVSIQFRTRQTGVAEQLTLSVNVGAG